MPREILSSSVDPTELCFQDLLKYDPLTPEQTEHFLNRVIAGREAEKLHSNNGFELPEKKEEYQQVLLEAKNAKDRLILHNLRFVYYVAERYKDQGAPLTDLIAEGATGLSIAIDRYDLAKAVDRNDPSKKTTFLAYAGPWVRKLILDYVGNNNGATRIPPRKRCILQKNRRTADLLMETLGRKPTAEEIAEKAGLTVKRVRKLLAQGQRRVISLNQTVNEENGTGLGELIEDKKNPLSEEFVDQLLLQLELDEVLQALTPREVKVLQIRFGLNDGKTHTLKEVGEMMSVKSEEDDEGNGNKPPRHMTVSAERAMQIEEKALSRLREPRRARKLRIFYDGEEG